MLSKIYIRFQNICYPTLLSCPRCEYIHANFAIFLKRTKLTPEVLLFRESKDII